MVDWPLEDRVIGSALRRMAASHGERELLAFGAVRQSYAEFNDATNRMAAFLSGLGVGQGDRVALFLPNCPEFLWAWFAAAKLGAVYVPINTEYRGDILQYQLGKAEVSHLVMDAEWLPRLHDLSTGLPSLRHVVVRGSVDNLAGGPWTRHDLDGFLACPSVEPGARVRYTDPHAISFTSGTTGPSKGVLATNSHVATFALDWIKAVGFTSEDRLYTCLPQFHAIATWLGFLPAILSGAHATVSERFSASRFWDEVRNARATLAHGIFSIVPILLKQPPRADDATQPATRFYIGQQNDDFERRFGCRVIEVFGSTETGIVTYTPLDVERRKGSCGRVNADTFDVMLVDDDDNEVGVGEVGEIVVRPRRPFSMLCEYYNMPTESLEAFRNQWFHTGDSARRDADGYLYFVDRKKDAIRRRGENISSFELENVVNRMPEVLECAAVAVPSSLGEDEVKLCIVRQPGAVLDAAAVWSFCDGNMPRFWAPRFIEFHESLPKTPNQKVRKFLLRETCADRELHDRGEGAGSVRAGR